MTTKEEQKRINDSFEFAIGTAMIAGFVRYAIHKDLMKLRKPDKDAEK